MTESQIKADVADIFHTWSLACPAACEGAAEEVYDKYIKPGITQYNTLAEASKI